MIMRTINFIRHQSGSWLKGIICGIILLFPSRVWLQDLGIYLMSRDQVFSGRNPALPFNKNTILALPEIRFDLHRQTGDGPWLVKQPDGSRLLSLASGWEGLERENYNLDLSWGLRTFFFGKKWGNFQLGISHEISGHSFFQFNKDLVGVLGYGNYGYLQKEPLAKSQALDVRPEFNHELFNGFGIEMAYQFNQFSVGGSLKYLSGLQEMHSEFNQFELDIRDPLAIQSKEDWRIYSADLVNYISLDSVELIDYSDIDLLGKHPGFSGSLGFAYQNPRGLFAVQWKDIGQINWNQGKLFSRKAEVHYSGIRVADLLNVDENVFTTIADTLKTLTSVTQSSIDFETQLSSSVLTEFQYKLNELWTVGAAFNYLVQDERWGIMGGFDIRVVKGWNIGSQLSYDSREILNLGLHSAVRLGPFNLFVNTDHIQRLSSTNKLKQYGARMGISFMW